MPRIAIIGAGRAATLHAEAVGAAPGMDLVGVGGRPRDSPSPLAVAMGVDDLPLGELAARADGLVVAVPPRQVSEVLARLAPDVAVLVESPVGLHEPADRPRAMTAANLLHADVVGRGLRAIARLGPVHHLVLRSRTVRPSWGVHGTTEFGGGVLIDPSAGLLPVLLAAAGTAVTAVTASTRAEAESTEPDAIAVESAASLTLHLADGRDARADLAWTATPGETEIEAAGAEGVVTIRLWPRPQLEVDGLALELTDQPPLAAFGFVQQMRRFGSVAAGDAPPWPPLSVGEGALSVAEAAARSAAHDGAPEQCGATAHRWVSDVGR